MADTRKRRSSDGGVVVPIAGHSSVPLASKGSSRELSDQLPLVELCARLLGRLWTSERAATTDRLTGLA
ncbi:MAG: hypothetical protein LC808_11940, partial [Actinobacteria bacterium]|nr:hypothetical protein [Actinomycetota bacterium]